jgi:hypothetical protein
MARQLILTVEPLGVSDPVGSVVISIKSIEGLPARAEIDAHWRRSHEPYISFALGHVALITQSMSPAS